MAGHARTVDTGKARRTPTGKARKIREHLPPGEAETAKRRKQHRGARTITLDRINRTTDALRQLDIAREYVRSAAAKYEPGGEITAAIEALLGVGDRIYQVGSPLSESARRTRRTVSERHRAKRATTAVLVREGTAAVRRQHNEQKGR